MWASRGGKRTPITLFVDGHSPEARDLSRLLNVSVVEHDNPVPPCEHSFVFCFSFPLPSLLYCSQRCTVTIVCYCSIIVPEFLLSLFFNILFPLFSFITFLSSPLFLSLFSPLFSCVSPPSTYLFSLRSSSVSLFSLLFPFSFVVSIFPSILLSFLSILTFLSPHLSSL